MNATYDLLPEVQAVVTSLRRQDVAVQLLVGGEVSVGWSALLANPATAAAKALELMRKYGCGIEVDKEGGGTDAGGGLVKFIQLVAAGKPNNTFVSMDVDGTPTAGQAATIKGAIDELDWVNMMVGEAKASGRGGEGRGS